MTDTPLLPLFRPTRRGAIFGAAGLGVTLSFLGGAALASDEASRRKLVVVICRGGLDGLSLSPPVGDPDYAALRGPIALAPFGAPGGALKLDGTFGLHPALPLIHALALKGEARIAPAVATPDRERSHFEAQDVLESGAAAAYGTSSGWLNRAVAALGPAGGVKALSVGATAPLILRGTVRTESWFPGGTRGDDARLPYILEDLYAHDPILGPALAAGLATQSMAGAASATAQAVARREDDPSGSGGGAMGPDKAARRGGAAQARTLGATLAGFMIQPGGPRVAAVEIDGFDTHATQGAAEGRLAQRLSYVDAFVDGLSNGLGAGWGDTIVVMATEFGRTARVNGTAGTDHGTASTAVLLGGALKKGGIVGDWPTLARAKLFEDRDTAPTLDMRAIFKGVLRDHLGVDRAALDGAVFPASRDVAPVSGLA